MRKHHILPTAIIALVVVVGFEKYKTAGGSVAGGAKFPVGR